MTQLAIKITSQDKNFGLVDNKFIEINDAFSKKYSEMLKEMDKQMLENVVATSSNHEHRLGLCENQLRSLFSTSILTAGTIGEGDMNRSPGAK